MREPASEPSTLSAGVEAVTIAQAELRTLVYRLADEVSSFRRRALAAEARQRELEQALQAHAAQAQAAATAAAACAPVPDPDVVSVDELRARVAELEQENGGLRSRLDQATERARLLLERTRFLRQQQEQAEEAV